MSSKNNSPQLCDNSFWQGPEFAGHVTDWLDSASLIMGIAETHHRKSLHVQGMFMAAHGIELALKGLGEREAGQDNGNRTHDLQDLWRRLENSEDAQALEKDYPKLPDMLALFHQASVNLRYFSENSDPNPEKQKQDDWHLQWLPYGDSRALLWVLVAFTRLVWQKSKEDWPTATLAQWEARKQNPPLLSEKQDSDVSAKRNFEMQIGTCVQRITKRSLFFNYDLIDPTKEGVLISQLRDAKLSGENIRDTLNALKAFGSVLEKLWKDVPEMGKCIQKIITDWKRAAQTMAEIDRRGLPGTKTIQGKAD